MIQIFLPCLLLGLTASFDFDNLDLGTVEAAISNSCKLRELYDAYKTEHGLLRCRKEDSQRHVIFKKTLLEIRKLKRNPEVTWNVGFTPLSDLTDDEIEVKHMGANSTLDSDFLQDVIDNTDTLSGSKIPESFDWRNPGSPLDELGVGFVTRVQKQEESSCWARAAVVPLEALIAKHTGKLVRLSAFQLYDCTYKKSRDRGHGKARKAWEWLQETGHITDRDTYPDRPGSLPVYNGQEACTPYPNYFAGFTLDSIKQVKDSESLAKAVYNNSPVEVMMEMKGLDTKHYKGGLFYGTSCDGGEHMMGVVGYTKQAFIMKNSWGRKWGDRGYMSWDRTHSGYNCNMYGSAYYPTVTYHGNGLKEE